jgi:SAM-dependent methyltransferase
VTDSSYEAIPDFGGLYDAVPAYATRRDIPFYVDQAARLGRAATVLELGCGTGRVLLPLARNHHTITGLDQSHAMLTQCRAKLAAEPAEVRHRVTLCEADVRDFAVALPTREGFTLAIAPFRVLQHLTTTADQVRCFERIRQHLAPGGRFVFDVFNPHYALMLQDRSQEVEDTAECQLPDGRHLRRTVRVPRVRWVEQLSEVELIYYVRTGDSTRRFVQSVAMRWYTLAEVEHLLGRSGFSVDEVYGDFDRSVLTDESPEIIVVASLRAAA